MPNSNINVSPQNYTPEEAHQIYMEWVINKLVEEMGEQQTPHMSPGLHTSNINKGEDYEGNNEPSVCTDASRSKRNESSPFHSHHTTSEPIVPSPRPLTPYIVHFHINKSSTPSSPIFFSNPLLKSTSPLIIPNPDITRNWSPKPHKSNTSTPPPNSIELDLDKSEEALVEHYLTTHKSNQTTPAPRSKGEESKEEIEVEPSLLKKDPLDLDLLISQFVFLSLEDATK